MHFRICPNTETVIYQKCTNGSAPHLPTGFAHRCPQFCFSIHYLLDIYWSDGNADFKNVFYSWPNVDFVKVTQFLTMKVFLIDGKLFYTNLLLELNSWVWTKGSCRL